MFEKIKEFIEDETSFVCVLIDEVESLTTARTRASENEPSDAIRVVNAVLTQLDQLKKYKNVVVLTTSNVTHAIDLAFVDRADIKQYIGPPGVRARYQILSTCLGELMRVGVIENSVLNFFNFLLVFLTIMWMMRDELL
jgi:SpoVK/Ycf46/Vps4 family AAA+-type ATPase